MSVDNTVTSIWSSYIA